MVEGDRPRERLSEKGPNALSDAELLAVIMGNGSNGMNAVELGATILSRHDDLASVDIRDLCKIKGVGKGKACRILAAYELSKRAKLQAVQGIKGADDAIRFCKPIVEDLEQENFLVVFLNAKNCVLGYEIVTRGLVNSSQVHPREVFRPAIKNNASAIIVAHNHPSGDPTPSKSDYAVTNQLRKAGLTLGIPLLDHLIVAKNSCFSFSLETACLEE